jgi:twinkle protein
MSSVVLAKQPCPVCDSSDAYHLYDDGHGFCFSCRVRTAAEGTQVNTNTYEYVPTRGITKTALEFYDIKTKVGPDSKPLSTAFRWPNGAVMVRYWDRKDFFWTTDGDPSTGGLFGRERFSAGSHKYVTITEGAYDAASLWQVVRTPVVSVQSAGTARRDCSVDYDWLQSFERIYLAFDNDAAGRAACAAVAKLFDYSKVYLVKFTKYKDANDYVRHGESGELLNIWNNSKKYLPEAIVSAFSDFQTILTETHKPAISYPFPTLTEMTYGIRTGESILITALEGVGKTEFLHAIEHHLLQETDDAIGAIFLEEPKRRHLQAVAGLHLQRPVHLPSSGVSETEVMEAVKQACRVDERLHIYSHFGSDDPEILLDNIRFLVGVRSCRWILLDHIGMAVSGLLGDDERRALDYLSTRLEMMVKELDFGLLMVSHVNDNGLTRGSRMISKICDIRIDLTRDLEAGEKTTHLKISKNRFCGRTGPAGDLIFDQNTYSLHELSDVENNIMASNTINVGTIPF